MKQTKLIMGMPITIEIADQSDEQIFKKVFSFFRAVDKRFSTYKQNSEISLFNKGKIKFKDLSQETKEIFKLAEKTKKETNGFFDIKKRNGQIDPSGIVKGWAIYKAAQIIKAAGFKNFYIDAGGDIQVFGKNSQGKDWTVGIKNPFNEREIVKVLSIKNQEGIATSGTYIRGEHIYNPKGEVEEDVVSLTVIGPNIYEADRMATAAFAMGKKGIEFIEKLDGFEGYLIERGGMATLTSNFGKFVAENS